MTELDEYDLAIIGAAHVWWSEKKSGPGGSNFALMSPPLRALAKAIEDKRQAILRSQEFGPTPASQDPFYAKELDDIRGRQDAQAEALKRSRDRIREVELAVEHVRSFLGPAFQEWEEKCQRT